MAHARKLKSLAESAWIAVVVMSSSPKGNRPRALNAEPANTMGKSEPQDPQLEDRLLYAAVAVTVCMAIAVVVLIGYLVSQ